MTVDELVAQALRDKASDIHLVRGLTPRYRVDGEIREMNSEVLTVRQCEEIAQELMGAGFTKARVVGESDLALTIAGVRCRLNLFRQQGSWSTAIRLLNEHIPDIAELGLPKVAAEFPAYSQGLVLITGETGSGKSTTLAAILNQINRKERKHILTLEDPIEYVYTPDKCVINQREVGKDHRDRAYRRRDGPFGIRNGAYQLRCRLHRPYRGRISRRTAAADPFAAVHVSKGSTQPAAAPKNRGRPGAGLRGDENRRRHPQPDPGGQDSSDRQRHSDHRGHGQYSHGPLPAKSARRRNHH